MLPVFTVNVFRTLAAVSNNTVPEPEVISPDAGLPFSMPVPEKPPFTVNVSPFISRLLTAPRDRDFREQLSTRTIQYY